MTLYDLFVSSERSFYSMELVRGPSLLEHVRTASAPRLMATTAMSVGSEEECERATRPRSATHRSIPAAGFDVEHLTSSFRQIASGLRALHSAGMLHRDLKPSNVLVHSDGRVMVSDFGLVTTTEAAGPARRRFVGTAAYAAPEQAVGATCEASDWYSFGCMLFEALTGVIPFEGTREQVLAAKGQFDPPRVCGSTFGALCNELLRLEPSERPSADVVARSFGDPASDVEQRLRSASIVGTRPRARRARRRSEQGGFFRCPSGR